jgi:DNA polymerase III subunit delta
MIYKNYLIEQNFDIIKQNITLFYGENLGLINIFKKKIKSINIKSTCYYLNQDEILNVRDNFYQEFLNFSLFHDTKIYFIERSNDNILDLIKSLEEKISTQKIYLFSEILDKKSKLRSYSEKSKNIAVVPCYKDNENILKGLIVKELNGFAGLTSENINLIINNSALDRAKLNNELEKIKTYFVNKKILSDDLQNLLNYNEIDDFSYLRDFCILGNKKKTNKLLENTLIDNEKIIYYLNALNLRFNKLEEILSKKNLEIEKAIDTIKPPIFWKDRPILKEQAFKLKNKNLKPVFRKLFDLEKTFKSNSQLNKSILLKKFIIDICNYVSA